MRARPHHFATTGATAGDVLLYDATVDEYRPGSVPVAGVAAIVQGANVKVDNTDPTHPVISATRVVPLTTAINGVPDLVWDTNNQMVFAEVPSV